MKFVEIEKSDNELLIKTLAQRLDGDNYILNALLDGNFFHSDYDGIELDLFSVEFINSLGITELVNLHRKFTEGKKSPSPIRFINVDRKVNAILELVDFHKVVEISVKE